MRLVTFALGCAGLWKISKMRFRKTVGTTGRNVSPDKSQYTEVFSEPHIIFLTLREELGRCKTVIVRVRAAVIQPIRRARFVSAI